MRKIPVANDALKRLEWDRRIYGAELYRKTAGVLGLGKVGSRVAARLRAFDMTVLVYDPYIPESRARELGVRLTDLAPCSPRPTSSPCTCRSPTRRRACSAPARSP